MRGEADDLDARDAARGPATPWNPPSSISCFALWGFGRRLPLFAGIPQRGSGRRRLVRHVAAPGVEPAVDRLTMLPFLIVTARMVVLRVAGRQGGARALKAPRIWWPARARWRAPQGLAAWWWSWPPHPVCNGWCGRGDLPP
jgi:hypothetical protein